MSAKAIKRLKDYQLKKFDKKSLTGKKWQHIRSLIDKNFPSGRFYFVDLGGGNGLFADRIFDHYPQANGLVLDNSQTLLKLNKPHPNKAIVHDSAENIDQILNGQQIDIIFMHFVLHHFVTDNYQGTREMQRNIISNAANILSSGGFIGIFESIYDGRFIDNLPGWLIYNLTSSKAISFLIRLAGANTAGCGVCFLSKKEWDKEILSSGCEVVDYSKFNVRMFSNRLYTIMVRTILHIGPSYQGYFWVKKK